ncbi:amidohydrolase family protein [Telluria mixta]|uniref:Amidohydrolase family protein n=1 Tax=Telluria mixta TaxID=34071 RepID=A0ABT2C8Q3_9BURK|nr:amidohydrolase family protein [Telluria mixta]MCS0633789.1 amidohydrolase family protein [Telluria mixta]WEM95064.1 amidohydrolase family protein [Telluria mixta]
MNAIRALIAAPLAALLFAGAAHAQTVPAGDYHQHVFSAADIAMLGPSTGLVPLDADQLVPLLDAAGIKRAVLLSIAYMYGSPSRKVDDEVAKVRAENDWTAAQAARHPGRLIAFCSFNPLKDYALAELERCAQAPGLNHGIKLHVGNSDVQLDDPAHVARLRQVFAAANVHGMAIVIHLRANIGKKRPYGATQARIFLDQVLPAAPDVVVQVAHFAGSGPGYDDPPAQAAMAVLADAVENHDPHANNLWFDVASIVDRDIKPETAALVVKRIRQVGVGRVLYGTDSAQGANLRPRESWAAFRKLPLSPAEFAHIAANVPPYFPEP